MSTDEVTTGCPHARNLAYRESDGGELRVWLNWEPGTSLTWIVVIDHGYRLRADVPNEKALDAFYHPYVYIGLDVAALLARS